MWKGSIIAIIWNNKSIVEVFMLAQTVIDLVESNYCFEDEQAETWKSVKKELLKCEGGRDDRSTECEWIDRLLCRLGDPHFRLFNTHINAYLFNVVLDLRGNTGGFINEAESLVSAIAETDIEYDYYVRSRDEDKQIKSRTS